MTHDAEQQALSALAADLYDATLDPALWRPALGRVRDFVGGASAGIVTKNASANRGFVCFDDGSIAPDYTAAYFDRYVAIDPCTSGHYYATPDNPVSTADIIPYPEFLDSRFYREWARPQGLIDYMGAAIERSGTSAVVFNVMRHESDGRFDDAARRRMRLVAPHVQRAVAISSTIELKTAATTSFAEILDGLSAGVFLTDAEGRIVHMNGAGRAILAEGEGIYAAGGRLAARHPDARRALGALLAGAGSGAPARATGGNDIGLAARNGEHYAAHVLPLTSGNRRDLGAPYPAVAALFVHKASLAPPSEAECIARHHRLTPTELRVLLAIVEAGNVPLAAEALGVAESTVKTHLSNLYGKTGTSRQADLVKLVAGYASPLLH
jgi:DNA-binding CsgD family transcriptional regulator/PAS domain-containing protein